MKRKIKVIAKISKYNFGLYAIEKVKNKNILIFQEENEEEKSMQEFFFNSLQKINAFLKTKVKKIFIYLNNFSNFNFLTKEFKITTNIDNSKKIVDNKAFKSNLEKAKLNFNVKNYSKISFRITNFITNFNDIEKQYLIFPLNKSADKLTVSYNVNYINKEYFQFLTNFFNLLELKIENIFTNINSIESLINIDTSNNINKVVINIDENNSWIAIFKENSNSVYKNLNLNFDDLINQIKDKFNLTKEKAKQFLKIYGKILSNEDLDYYIYENINAKYISNIIINFVEKISFEINEFVKKNNAYFSQIYWLGELIQIENFDVAIKKLFLNKENILYSSKYKPDFNKTTKEIILGIEYIYMCLKSQLIREGNLVETQAILNDELNDKKNRIFNLFKSLIFRR
ncbi:cell division protein FtsA [[Mycoplasma] collis]|uniref:hypothetical protein n=1 Tax=[Mycoplasma] collis TaxID=2127 RepID=UPI00051B7477|nr:hypothetical protein [[Mycoplasma] collis]